MRFLQIGFAAIMLHATQVYAGGGEHSKAIVEYYAAVEAFEACLHGKATEPCGDPPTPPPVTDEGLGPIKLVPDERGSPCSPPFSWLADGLGVDCWPLHPLSYSAPCRGASSDYVPGVPYCARDNDRDDRGVSRAVAVDSDDGGDGNRPGGVVHDRDPDPVDPPDPQPGPPAGGGMRMGKGD